MTKFLNTEIDFEKQEPFIERIILVIILLFSIGTVGGITGYIAKEKLDKPVEIEIFRLTAGEKQNQGIVKSEKIEVTQDVAGKVIERLIGNYDPNRMNYFVNDLDGDEQGDMIITTYPDNPTLYIVTPTDKTGAYKSIAKLELSQNAEYRPDRPSLVRSEANILDIDGDGKKEIVMDTGTGGAYTTASGIFKVDWKAGTVEWLKVKKANGNIINTAFFQGASVMHKLGFSISDIDGDNVPEVVEVNGDYVGPNGESIDTDKELDNKKNWKWQSNVYKWDGTLFSYSKDLSAIMAHFASLSIKDFMFLDLNGDDKKEIALTEVRPSQADSVSKEVVLSVFTYNSKSDTLRKVYEDASDEINGTGFDLYIIGKGSASAGKKEQLLVGKTIAGSRHGFVWYMINEKFKPVEFDQQSMKEREKVAASYGEVQIEKVNFSLSGLIMETGRVFLDKDPGCCASGKEVYFYYQLKNGKLYYIKDIAARSSSAGSATRSAEEWKTYKDEKNGFEIKYPADFLVKKDKDASGTIDFLTGVMMVEPDLAGKSLIKLAPQIRDSYDSSLTVHVSEGNNALSGCLKEYRGSEPEDLTSKKDINGVIFYKESLSEGVGDDSDVNSYFMNEITSYKTIYQNKCYQISVYDFFHTSSGGSGPEKERLNDKMKTYDEILSTFKFIATLAKSL